MNKKRVVALVASAMMVVSLFAGCGSSTTNSPTSTAKKVVIGLSTDQGGLNDK